jgi:hypothetical protein
MTKEVSFTVKAKDAASAVLKQVENSLKGTTEKMFSFKTALGAVSGLAAGFSLSVLIKDLFDLGVASDKAFRQITANLPTAHAGLTQLRQDMSALANESGRSVAEIQAAAVEISRLGVSSAAELSTRLRAATTFADATGLELKATVQGLDQVMDEFSLSAEQAEEMLARLRSASKGRGDVESLFAAFTAGAPALVKLGIDADTATKALVALLDKGIAPARAGKMLLQYDSAALRELASDAKIAETAVADLRKEAEENRASFERDAQRIKNELAEIGLAIADKVLVPLRGWKLLLEEIKAAGGIQNILPGLKSFMIQSPQQVFGQPWTTNHGTSGSWGDPPPTPGKPGTLPLTIAQLDEIEKKAKKAAEELKKLREQIAKLGPGTGDNGIQVTATAFDAAAKRTKEFAQEIANLMNAAKENGLIKPAELPDAPEHKDTAKNILEIADAWETVGRSVIGAAQAMGQMDAQTAATLQNVLTLGEGLVKMFATGGKQGGAESATSLAALVAGLFKGGPSQEEIDARNNSVAKLITSISQQLSPTRGASLSELQERERQRFADARGQVESDLGGKRNELLRESKLRDLNILEAQRLQQLEEEFALKQKESQEDYEVRRLRATGLNQEADALAFALEQHREYTAAIESASDPMTKAALEAAQLAEAQKFAADAAHAAVTKLLNAALSLANAGIAIDDVTDPTKAFGVKAKAYAGAGGSLGEVLKGFNLDNLSADDIAALDAKLRDLFHQLKESPGSVDLAGLSIEDLIAALLDLDSAADGVAAAVAAAAQTMYQSANDLEAYWDVHETPSIDQVYDQAKKGSLPIDNFDFDLTTQAGRDAALAWLTNAFDTALTKPEADGYRQLIGMIRRLPPLAGGSIDLTGALGPSDASSISHGFQSFTTTQGDRLADYQLRQVNLLTDIRDILSGKVSVARPGAVNLTAAAAQLGSGGLVIGTVEVHVTSDKENAEQEGRDAARGFADELRRIDADLGRKVVIRQRYNGSIRVTA